MYRYRSGWLHYVALVERVPSLLTPSIHINRISAQTSVKLPPDAVFDGAILAMRDTFGSVRSLDFL